MRRIAQRWWLVGLVLVACVVAVAAVLRHVEVSRGQTQQRSAQRQAVALLRSSVQDVLTRELALGRVISAVNGHIKARWPALASIVLSQPVAHSVGFVQPVTQADLVAFERRSGLQVAESQRPGVVRPVSNRPVHLVVTEVTQKGPGVPRLGLDMAASPARAAALAQAEWTGSPIATPPVMFLTSSDHMRGVVVYTPVRSSRGTLLGWVTASYGARQLVAMVTSHAPGTRLTIEDGHDVLVATGGSTSGPPATISALGRTWKVWAQPAPAGLSSAPWLVLAFGLVLAAAVSIILRQTVARERDASRTLAERDAEEGALREIATLVAENTAPSVVLAAVAQQVGRVFASRTASLSRFDPDENRGTIVGGWTTDGVDLVGTQFALDGVTASAQVFRNGGRVARAESGYRQSRVDPIAPLMSTLSATGGIAAPIFVAGELWGALGAAYSEQPIPIGAEDRLERFAQLVGLTISNTEAWEKLARQASTDSLTGLANRRVFRERLTAELARARRYQRNLSLVLIDLDHFKGINDEHGHQAGDRVLVRFAQLLGEHTRDGELIARVGGEEFAWVVPETDQAGCYAAADRLRSALENEAFRDLGRVTLSAGIRFAGPADDADTLIRHADQALYWAKETGRNMVFVYSEQARRALPSDGRRA